MLALVFSSVPFVTRIVSRDAQSLQVTGTGYGDEYLPCRHKDERLDLQNPIRDGWTCWPTCKSSFRRHRRWNPQSKLQALGWTHTHTHLKNGLVWGKATWSLVSVVQRLGNPEGILEEQLVSCLEATRFSQGSR